MVTTALSASVVDGLSVVGPEGEPIHEIGHLPISESAMDQSVIELLEQGAPIPDLEGYDTWRKAFSQGQGGTFDKPVAVIIAATEELIATGQEGK